MSTVYKAFFSILLLFVCSAPMANASGLPHDEYMPADLYGSRQDRPDQMLFEVERYRVTLGLEHRPGALPNPHSAGAWIFLRGRPLIDGSPVTQARISFAEPGSRPRPARLDAESQTLELQYPAGYFDYLLRLLEADRPSYVQARFYGNGTVWADVHAGD